MEVASWWHVDDVLWGWEVVVSNSWMVEGSLCHTQQMESSQVHWSVAAVWPDYMMMHQSYQPDLKLSLVQWYSLQPAALVSV
jgi:hypothetical protein